MAMPRLLNGCAASGWTWWCHASDLVLNQPHLFNNPVTGRTLWIRGCYQLSLLCIALSAVLHPVEKKKKGEKRLKKNYYVIFVNFVASLWLRKTPGKAEQEEARGNDFLEALAVATALLCLIAASGPWEGLWFGSVSAPLGAVVLLKRRQQAQCMLIPLLQGCCSCSGALTWII